MQQSSTEIYKSDVNGPEEEADIVNDLRGVEAELSLLKLNKSVSKSSEESHNDFINGNES